VKTLSRKKEAKGAAGIKLKGTAEAHTKEGAVGTVNLAPKEGHRPVGGREVPEWEPGSQGEPSS